MRLAADDVPLPCVRATRCSRCGLTDRGVPRQANRGHLPKSMPIDEASRYQRAGLKVECEAGQVITCSLTHPVRSRTQKHLPVEHSDRHTVPVGQEPALGRTMTMTPTTPPRVSGYR